MADVVVEVGGWEHECCGEAVERSQLVDLHVVLEGGAVVRVPSGPELTAADEADEGLIEIPRSGEPVASEGRDFFLVTVRTSRQP